MKRNWLKGNKIYHLSFINHNGEVFKPRIPDTWVLSEEEEETKTKRVCFSKSISGAYLAIQFEPNIYEEMYVHIPVNENTRYFKPGNERVFDAEFTGEVWVTRPVKLKCIGKVKIGYPQPSLYSRRWRPKVYFKWLEKY